ncbi:MAG: YbaB/EbfC family nucleoid-associated protein [Fulvivirga sp.]|uniref:YbaB/EbfC family nucleoid-associated protein n=1 Tax=Fulvivirga sp. TaxID=1931237 RepID=UPI0032EF40D5
MFDMMKMMGKMKEVQAKIKEAQDNLVNIKASGEAGGGMVTATVNGKKEVIDLSFDDTLLKPEDKEMLQDLIVAAINKANAEVEVLAKEEMKKSTEGMIPNIPGLDLGGMFNG